jgi:5'-nucleotidase
MINSGGLRGDLEIGNITMYDVLTVLPFKNSIDIVTLKGKYLLEAFEDTLDGEFELVKGRMRSESGGGDGGYLQVSGFHLITDPSRPPGKRILEMLVRCAKCRMPRFFPIEEDKEYKVAMVEYLANGGDGLKVLKEKASSRLKGTPPLRAVYTYEFPYESTYEFPYDFACIRFPIQYKLAPILYCTQFNFPGNNHFPLH